MRSRIYRTDTVDNTDRRFGALAGAGVGIMATGGLP